MIYNMIDCMSLSWRTQKYNMLSNISRTWINCDILKIFLRYKSGIVWKEESPTLNIHILGTSVSIKYKNDWFLYNKIAIIS